MDYASRFMEAATQLGQWKMFGKLKARKTIVEGLEKAPDAINMLFTGGTTGTMIVKVCSIYATAPRYWCLFLFFSPPKRFKNSSNFAFCSRVRIDRICSRPFCLA